MSKRKPPKNKIVNFRRGRGLTGKTPIGFGPLNAERALEDISGGDVRYLLQKLSLIISLLMNEIEHAGTDKVSIKTGVRDYLALLFEFCGLHDAAILAQNDEFIGAMEIFDSFFVEAMDEDEESSDTAGDTMPEYDMLDEPISYEIETTYSEPPTPESLLKGTFVFRIALKDAEPAIWRRVNVPGHFTLEKLHHVIQSAMGWQNIHPHRFEIKNYRYSLPEYDNGCKDYRKRRLGKLRLEPGEKFQYIYDFNDRWEHVITVEEMVPEKRIRLAKLVDGSGDCPPENCGGIEKYNELKQHAPTDATKKFDLRSAKSAVRSIE